MSVEVQTKRRLPDFFLFLFHDVRESLIISAEHPICCAGRAAKAGGRRDYINVRKWRVRGNTCYILKRFIYAHLNPIRSENKASV